MYNLPEFVRDFSCKEAMNCPNCKSENTYYSKKRSMWVCEDCDETFTEKRAVVGDEQSAADEKHLKLFFSYGHDRNRPIVDRIKKDLRNRGHNVWIDTSELIPLVTESWRREILDGVMNSASVIAFLSEHSTRPASVCLDELKIAVCVRGADIKMVLLEPENRVSRPAMVSDIQWLDMSQWQEMQKAGHEAFEQWYKAKFVDLCKAIESDRTIQFSGEIQTLKEKLKPYLNADKEYSLLAKEFYGRAWLEEYIEHWQDKTSSRALVVYGKPGSGKSAFCVNYAHYHSDVYALFLCEWNKEHSISPHKLIRTLAFRLATKLLDYRSLLLRQLEADDIALDEMKPEVLFEYLLSYPLNQLVDGGRETGIIVVDGLDEAEAGDDNPVAKVFSQCVGQMPRWIKFLFTSRPERHVTQYLPTFDTLDIVDDMPEGYDDIKLYLLKTLETELRQLPNRLEVLNRICSLSEGVFLYAVLLAEDVKEGVICLQDTRDMPKGLNAFYHLSMERKFKTREEFQSVRPFLELLCVAETTPEEIILGICHYSKYAWLKLLDKFGSWVVRHQEDKHFALGFSHKSVSDWLCNNDQSGRFFVDSQAGALALAHYCKEKIEHRDATRMMSLLDDYIRAHVAGYYILAKAYIELEDFMISRQHELSPYWYEWNQFPDYWNHDRLLSVFWTSPDRDGFLNLLQREGNTGLLLWIFERAKEKYGIDKFGREMFSIYMDIVHLSGDCRKAVEMADGFLHGYTIDQILADDFLSMLYVRRLHHCMFFRPLRRLLDEAMDALGLVGPHFPVPYNELLFLIGGNLGVLLGEWDLAMTWLEKSEGFAQQHDLEVFHKRDMRKIADCLCHDGAYRKAESLILSTLGPEGKIAGRYDVYLTGALANIYTCIDDDDEALQCYDSILKYATAKGIVGWIAHAQLGIANINFKLSNLKEAVDFAKRAQTIYTNIKQEWGCIMSEALLSACESRLGVAPLAAACSNAIKRAKRMEYGSCEESIKALCKGECKFLKLYFI